MPTLFKEFTTIRKYEISLKNTGYCLCVWLLLFVFIFNALFLDWKCKLADINLIASMQNITNNCNFLEFFFSWLKISCLSYMFIVTRWYQSSQFMILELGLHAWWVIWLLNVFSASVSNPELNVSFVPPWSGLPYEKIWHYYIVLM